MDPIPLSTPLETSPPTPDPIPLFGYSQLEVDLVMYLRSLANSILGSFWDLSEEFSQLGKHPDFWKSGFLEIRKPGFLEIRISGNPEIRISAYPDFRNSDVSEVFSQFQKLAGPKLANWLR